MDAVKVVEVSSFQAFFWPFFLTWVKVHLLSKEDIEEDKGRLIKENSSLCLKSPKKSHRIEQESVKLESKVSRSVWVGNECSMHQNTFELCLVYFKIREKSRITW